MLFPKGVTRNNIVSVFLYSVNANDENCPDNWYSCSHFGLALANPQDKKIFIKKGNLFIKNNLYSWFNSILIININYYKCFNVSSF